VEWKEGMMQVARIADQVDGLAGQSAHAPLPRMVKGVSSSHRLQIKTTGADTPLRTLASFCEEHGGAQHVPTIQALRSQRKKFQRSHGACDERVSDSLLLWKRFVASIAFDQKKWDAAPLFKMFSVTINQLAPSPTEPDAPPICLLVCKAFLHHIMAWKNTRTTGSGAACCDVSWKLNIAGWGLVTIAGMATHFVEKKGRP
jgi:hypothetical protein